MAVGMRPPKRGLFGNPMMGAQAPMPASPMQPAPQDRLAAVTAPQAAPKPQGEKFDWAAALNALGGLMQGNTNAVAQYHQNQRQMAMQAEQEKRAAQMAEAQRMAGLQDYRSKREIDAEFATQTPPAIAQNYEFIRQTAGDEAAKDYVANYGRGPEQDVAIEIPGVGLYVGPRSGMQDAINASRGGGQAAPQGVTFKPIGGPSQSATGPFRP